jgi:hypothetical protein
MTATFQWTIDWMKTSSETINGFTQPVISAGWRCIGTETINNQIYTNAFYNSIEFNQPKVGDTFTSFEQLTQEQVIGWCWQKEVNQQNIEEAIQSNINLQAAPKEVTHHKLPWQNTTNTGMGQS